MDDTTKNAKLNKCFNTWPRTTALCFRIIIPLWILIGISLGFGLILASFEAPGEYASNDETVKERYVLSLFPSNEITTGLTNMSQSCLDYYNDIKNNQTTIENNPFLTLVDNLDFFTQKFPNVSVGFENQTPESVLGEAKEFASVCADIAEEIYDTLYNYTKSVINEEILTDLTFNWIRCWNSSSLGGTRLGLCSARYSCMGSNCVSNFFSL